MREMKAKRGKMGDRTAAGKDDADMAIAVDSGI